MSPDAPPFTSADHDALPQAAPLTSPSLPSSGGCRGSDPSSAPLSGVAEHEHGRHGATGQHLLFSTPEPRARPPPGLPGRADTEPQRLLWEAPSPALGIAERVPLVGCAARRKSAPEDLTGSSSPRALEQSAAALADAQPSGATVAGEGPRVVSERLLPSAADGAVARALTRSEEAAQPGADASPLRQRVDSDLALALQMAETQQQADSGLALMLQMEESRLVTAPSPSRAAVGDVQPMDLLRSAGRSAGAEGPQGGNGGLNGDRAAASDTEVFRSWWVTRGGLASISYSATMWARQPSQREPKARKLQADLTRDLGLHMTLLHDKFLYSLPEGYYLVGMKQLLCDVDDPPPPAFGADEVAHAPTGDACDACGMDSNLVWCGDAKKWLCNNRESTSTFTCCASHLRLHPREPIRLHPSNPRWGSRAVECMHTAEADVSRLGMVQVTVAEVSIVSQAFVSQHCPGYAHSFAPALSDFGRALAHWLVPCSHATTAVASRANVHRRVELQTRVANPVQFGDVQAYTEAFRHLVALVATEEVLAADSMKRHLSLRWGNGAGDAPMVYFEYNTGSKSDLKLNATVRISFEDKAGSVGSFSGRIVKQTRGSSTLGALLPLAAAAMCRFKVGTVLPELVTVHLDRMQTAIHFFGSDPLAISPQLQRLILGQGDGLPPLRIVRAPVTPAAYSLPDSEPLSKGQARAVQWALTRPLTILQGPPGTGKTKTAVAIVWHLGKQSAGRRKVLVCAGSNAAATHICRALAATGISVLRYFAPSQVEPEDLPCQCSMRTWIEKSEELSALEKQRKQMKYLAANHAKAYDKLLREVKRKALQEVEVVVMTCSAASDTLLATFTFDTVLIDEAAQLTEPDAMAALTKGCATLVLVGDHKQLRPLVKSVAAAAGGLQVSLFERMATCHEPLVCFLDTQYRMHPAISAAPSAVFYDGRLLDGQGMAERRASAVAFPWPTSKPLLIWHHQAREERGPRGHSFLNRLEAAAAVEAVRALLEGGADPTEVAIVAMYDAQRVLLGQLMAPLEAGEDEPSALSRVEVATVDSFQGREKDFIVITLTKASSPFVSDPRRANVALTRARCGLVVIGDVTALERSALWASLLVYWRDTAYSGKLSSLTPFNPRSASGAVVLSIDAFAAHFTPPSRYRPSFRCPFDMPCCCGQACPEREALAEVVPLNDAGGVLCANAAYVWQHFEATSAFLLNDTSPIWGDVEASARQASVEDVGPMRDAALGELFEARFLGANLESVPLAHTGIDLASCCFVDCLQEEEEDATSADVLIDSQGPHLLAQALTGSTALALAAEALGAEEVNDRLGTVPALAIGLIRRLQWYWRGRVVGFLGAHDTLLYWRLARSTRPDTLGHLRALCRSWRWDPNFPGQSLTDPEGRPHGAMVKLLATGTWQLPNMTNARATPALSRRGVLRLGGTPGDALLHLIIRRDAKELARRLARAPSQAELAAAVISHGFTPSQFEEQYFPSRARGVWYRQVRQCLCMYGALACNHYVRGAEGKPVLGKGGQPLLRTFMARAADFEAARQAALRIIDFYRLYCNLLIRVFPGLGILAGFCCPGGHSEGLRRLGFAVAGVDIADDRADFERWFGRIVPERFPASPVVTVTHGDALVEATRAEAVENHPTISDVGGHFDSPCCKPESTASAIGRGTTAPPVGASARRTADRLTSARRENLSECIYKLLETYRRTGQPFVVETVQGNGAFVPPEGVTCTILSGRSLGLQTHDTHRFYHPTGCPLFLDAVVRSAHKDLARRTCAGASRATRLIGPDGVRMRSPCCDGNMASFWNGGYFVHGKKQLASILDLDPEHVSSKPRYNDLLPPIQAMLAGALLGMWIASHRLGVPMVSADEARTDRRLGAWLLSVLGDLDEAMPVVSQAVVFVAPSNLPGKVLVDSDGNLPCVPVGKGALLAAVMSAFDAAFEGFTLSRLTFVCDFLRAPVPTIVFSTTSAACNDATALETGVLGGLKAVSIADLVADDKLAALSSLQHCALAAGHIAADGEERACIRRGADFYRFQFRSVSDQMLCAESDFFARGGKGGAPQDPAEETQAPDEVGAAMAVQSDDLDGLERLEREAWTPADGAKLVHVTMSDPVNTALAAAATVPADIGQAYAAAASKHKIGHVRNPRGGPADGPRSVVPAELGATTVFLMWKGHVLMHAQDASKLQFFSHYDCQGMTKADSAVASFSPWVAHLGAFLGLSKLVTALVTGQDAQPGRHGQVTWSVSSRDRTGRHPSLACPSRSVTADVYSIVLADDFDWSDLRDQPVKFYPRKLHSDFCTARVTAQESAKELVAIVRPPATSGGTPQLDTGGESGVFTRVPATAPQFLAQATRPLVAGQLYAVPREAAAQQCKDDDRRGLLEALHTLFGAAAPSSSVADSALGQADAEAVLGLEADPNDFSERLWVALFFREDFWRLLAQKSWESRLSNDMTARVKQRWLICCRSNGQSLCKWKEVIGDPLYYRSHAEAIRVHGSRLLPMRTDDEINAMSDTELEFLGFGLHHQTPSLSAARRWCGRTDTTGRVTCWQLRDVPPEAQLPSVRTKVAATPRPFSGSLRETFQRYACTLRAAAMCKLYRPRLQEQVVEKASLVLQRIFTESAKRHQFRMAPLSTASAMRHRVGMAPVLLRTWEARQGIRRMGRDPKLRRSEKQIRKDVSKALNWYGDRVAAAAAAAPASEAVLRAARFFRRLATAARIASQVARAATSFQRLAAALHSLRLARPAISQWRVASSVFCFRTNDDGVPELFVVKRLDSGTDFAPGGKPDVDDPKELAVAAARRGLAEECSLSLGRARFAKCFGGTDCHGERPRVLIDFVVSLSVREAAEVRISGVEQPRITEGRWFTLEQINVLYGKGAAQKDDLDRFYERALNAWATVKAVSVARITCERGLTDPSMVERGITAICVGSDCSGLHPAPGTEAAQVLQAFPQASGAQRHACVASPGTIFHAPSTAPTECPHVFHLFSQGPAEPSSKVRAVADSSENLRRCLALLGEQAHVLALKDVALPWRLGCAAGCHQWPAHQRLIQEFATQHPWLQVHVVQTSADLVRHMQRTTAKEVSKARRDAQAYVSKLPQGITRTLGTLLVEQLDAQVKHAFHDPGSSDDESSSFMGVPTASVRLGLATAAGGPEEASPQCEASVAVAIESVFAARLKEAAGALSDAELGGINDAALEVRKKNDRLDVKHREQVLRDHASGVLTDADVAEICDEYSRAWLHRGRAGATVGARARNAPVRVFGCDSVRAGTPGTVIGQTADGRLKVSLDELDDTGRFPTVQVFSGSVVDDRPIVRSEFEQQVEAAGQQGAPRVRVSSANGRFAPARLLGALLCTPFKSVLVDVNVFDSGSGTCILGYDDALRWERDHAGSLKRVSPLPSSVRRIRGIGALNEVAFWVQFTLDLGGCMVDFLDVPVLHGHRGLLLGNDFIGQGRCKLQYATSGSVYEGTATLYDEQGVAVSAPVPFATNAGEVSAFLSTAAADDDGATGSGGTAQANMSTAETVGEGSSCNFASTPSELKSETLPEELLRSLNECAPLAYAGSSLRFPAWSQQIVKVKTPASLAKTGRPLALVPLEAAEYGDLGVMLAPCLGVPDKDGFMECVLINLSREVVPVSMLSPIARFVIDPELGGPEVEFTSAEIMKLCHIGPDDQMDKAKIAKMLSTRRSLFRSALGHCHMDTMKIVTPDLDSGVAQPPSAQNTTQPPDELAALEATRDKMLKNRVIEPCRSPFNAKARAIIKHDGTYRVVIDWRKLNLLTTKVNYPLPNVEANLAALGKANWFTTLDLLQGFHQVELDSEETMQKTAFTIGNGQYRFRRMPMGLTSSPGTFMQLVDASLRGLPPGIALAYV